MNIKFIYLDRLWEQIKIEALYAIEDQYRKGFGQGGPIVEEVEEQIAKECGRDHAVLVNNCTNALILALEYSVSPGDKVLVPAYTFISTAAPILAVGATPVFLDVDENYEIDLIKAEKYKAKALIFVNLFGRPSNYEKIKSFCEKNYVECIEDAAHNYGDPLADTTVYSFSPSKNLPVFGSGGAIVTNDPEAAEEYKFTRHPRGIGYNMIMGSGEIAQLQVCLNHKDEWQQNRWAIAKLYNKQFKNIIKIPEFHPSHTWHKYVIQTSHRDQLKKHLEDNGIQTGIHYRDLVPDDPIFNRAHLTSTFPCADSLSKTSLSLPIHSHMFLEEAQYVADNIKEFVYE